jgi:hypothetical protein
MIIIFFCISFYWLCILVSAYNRPLLLASNLMYEFKLIIIIIIFRVEFITYLRVLFY